MIELLAIPAWQSTPKSLDDWVEQLGGPSSVVIARESAGVSWLEVGSLRLRGYAVLEGLHVEAINFELSDPDPGPATRALEAAALALGWELHAEDEDHDEETD